MEKALSFVLARTTRPGLLPWFPRTFPGWGEDEGILPVDRADHKSGSDYPAIAEHSAHRKACHPACLGWVRKSIRLCSTPRILLYTAWVSAFHLKPGLSTAATFRVFLPGQRGAHHGPGASHAAFYCDGVRWAIELAGAAFHTGFLADQLSQPAAHVEYRVRADRRAHSTTGACVGIVLESVGKVSIEHVPVPFNE